ncbi:MAG: N-acetylneuraminate synthase family protein, partial [Nitrosotalea sp.]
MFNLPKIGKVSQFKIFKELELSDEVQKKLFDYAKKKKIVFFSTPADKDDVDFLESLSMKIYKIGSDDATNIPLLEYIAKLDKPTIISTGMCNMSEVKKITKIFSSCGNNKLVLLHCVTKYPTEPEYVNLKAIDTMKKEFNIPIGYSDHSLGIEVCKAAIALGANIIEKHVTMDTKQSGPDHILSATPAELRDLVNFSTIFYKSLGNGIKIPAVCEKFNRKESRKSIVASKNIPKGIKITDEMIVIKRPGYGIEPENFKKILGKKTRVNIKKDQVLRWSDID